MRKILDRLTALVMVMLMFIQTCVPAITSFAKEEELDKRYVIQKLETLKQDTYANFSLNLATILDDKNLDTDTNVKFILNATSTDSNIKLLVRKDFSLYDERTFDKVEDAYKEFDRIDKSLKDQGLSLDVSVVQDGEKYRIKNNYVPQAGKEDFGSDYKVYSLKVIDKFDFDKQGLYNKLPENDKLSAEHNLQIAEQRRLQQDGEVPEPDKHNVTYIFNFKVDKSVDPALTTIALNKDANNPLEVKQNADLFAAILNDKTYSVYQTEQLPAEVTSSIEHKKEVAKKKAEADAKAKKEADEKAKKEADEKAKKEAEEKAKKEAEEKAKKEADEKAKKEAEEKAKADSKAKQEADKKKSEEAKKSEEQKAAEEKAKQEADAKAKAEAEAKAKAEAEKLAAAEKAKQEQLAKEQAEAEAKRAAEEKAKKDLENKKLLGLVKDTEEKQEEEPIIKKKEIKEEVKSEPATPQERKQKAEEFDKALQDRKEEIKKSEDKKDANNKEDNKKTTDKKEVSKETKGLLEGIKEFFGFSNLQKADRELKAILSVKANGLKEVQALLSSFEDKYHLTQEEQAKLMDDNKDAIKALIEKDADKNFRPQMLMTAMTRKLTEAEQAKLEGKKFHILTRFDTSNANGPIQPGQFFNIHLDNQLKVKDVSSLPPLEYNGKVITEKPTYDSGNNILTYKIKEPIAQNIQVPVVIPVDYNTANIKLDDNGNFTVINKVSGLGLINPPKDLLPQKVDVNGNPAGSIIEPGRNDVTQIIEPDDSNYKVDMDAVANPVLKDGELQGYNWTVRISSDTDLTTLGYKANFTVVKGSGLGDITSRGSNVTLTDQLDGALGIHDSKHHAPKEGTREITYNLYTQVQGMQEKYMMDISVILTNKKDKKGNPKVGAKRFVVDGWPIDKVKAATPIRAGLNNRTTILGEFTSENSAKWTVTDGVSTGDTNVTLPLENRTLGNQTLQNGQVAVYGLNANGEMAQIGTTSSVGSVPTQGTNPGGGQAVGNIAVYEYNTNINDNKKPQTLGGVAISKYQDINVEQNWNLPDGQKMPAQTITVTDKNGNTTETTVGEGPVVSGDNGKQRLITVPNVKYWDIARNGDASPIDHKVSQSFPSEKVMINYKEYKYSENANYFRPDTKIHYIQNSLDESTNNKLATFTVVKVDSAKPEQRVPGASFDLLGANVSITTDANGEATFRNIKPGTYYLTETKAPDGYKIDQNQKTVKISNDGQISVYGGNAKLSAGSGKTEIVEHSDYPNWPDFMNAMHYGKLDSNGNLEFYVYLKPFAPRKGGRTDKDTRFNISIPGVNLTNANVTIHDFDPTYRDYYTYHMQEQTMGKATIYKDMTGSGDGNRKITGTANYKDPYTGKIGYSIFIPENRFGTDWGFLVKVKAKVARGTNPATVSYDWLANENTASNSKIQEDVEVSTNPAENGPPTITITNEKFKKSPIEVVKLANTFSEVEEDGKKVKKRDRLSGAEFVLKDANGKPITNAYTNDKGKVNFGEFPPGRYYIEEKAAPSGYEKSDVYYEVIVNEKGEVTYNAKFKTSSGTPVLDQDYAIERGEETVTDAIADVTEIHQHMDVKDSGRGRFQGVWEAYELESLKYTLDAKLTIKGPGSRFEIQFDKNLDFTQYFTEFPLLYDNGKVIAKPYFDRNTNLLTYVFTENATAGPTTIKLNLFGMIPNKFYAKTHGEYEITNVVAPGKTVTNNTSNQTETIKVKAYFGEYDAQRDSGHKPKGSPPSQQYYFRDVYQDNNGDWYVKAFAYYNPYGNYAGGARNINFNWMSTDYQQDKIQHQWEARGNMPAFKLENVKVYRADKSLTTAKYYNGRQDVTEEVSAVMPLSMGIRPEQDPSTYLKVFETNIDPDNFKSASNNNVYLEYNPKQITPNSVLQNYAPLKMTMPKISGNREGYVIEQTFRIPDIKKFNEKWRAFYMGQGTSLESTFITGPNKNYGNVDQTGQEIPKFYKEEVGIINKKFTPGQFKITKTDDNTGQALEGALFALTDSNGKAIYKTSANGGLVEFTNLSPGRYTLREIQAPKGYTGSNEKWEVIVSNDGYVRIEETSVTSQGNIYTGNNNNIINIPVTNRKIGESFQVFKKDEDGEPLKGATFTITKQGDTTPTGTATSDDKGIVTFERNLSNGTYIIEETKAPDGYKELNEKWVLVIENNKKKVYKYSKRTSADEQSLFGEKGTYIVNVKDRPQTGWEGTDNRNTGWAGNNTNAEHLGTRIIAINKEKKYVIQRYVINPEAKQTKGLDGITSATIHREKPNYPNMDWYNEKNPNNTYKIFTLGPKVGGNTDGKVSGLISDLRLADYTVTDITSTVKKEADSKSHFGETRLKLSIPETNKPIVVDVKVPYSYENGGVGTGMDWRENGVTYWKSDYYERVSDIVLGDSFQSEVGSIKGSYIGENSLDVTNEAKTYGFKLKKVKENETIKVIPGAKFQLTGPDGSIDEMTTGNDGTISFDGLKPGTYTLKETTPAPGYENTTATWTVTVTKTGKVYYKVNNPDSVNNTASVATLNLMSRAKSNIMSGVNTAVLMNINLEMSPELIGAALKAADGWEDVDLSKSQGKFYTKGVENQQKIQTRITKINTSEGKLRQVFLVNKMGDGMNESTFDFHPEPFNTSLIGEGLKKPATLGINFKIISIRPVSKNSNLLGNDGYTLNYDGNKTYEYKDAQNYLDKTKNKYRYSVKLKGGSASPLAIEVEYDYPESGEIGLGMNYKATYNSQSAWAAQNFVDVKYVNIDKVEKFTVIFDENGGSGTMAQAQVDKGAEYTLPENKFMPPTGKEFKAWEVNGVEKAVGDKITINGNTTIKAIWQNEQIIISFDGNGGNYNKTPEKVDKGSLYTIPGNPFIAPTGKEFKGWKVNEVTKQPGDQIKVDNNLTLIAIWGAPASTEVTITLSPGVGSGQMITQKVTPGSSYTLPAANTFTPPNGKKFAGWLVGNKLVQAGQPIKVGVDTTITAQWRDYKISVASDIQNGSVTASPANAQTGHLVTLNVTPNTGFEIESVSMNGQALTATNGVYTFTMPDGDANVTATFKQVDLGTEIPTNDYAIIKNKQTGLKLNVFKVNSLNRRLPGAEFTIVRYTDENYTKIDSNFTQATGTSDENGVVVFKDANGKNVSLPVGHYLITETKSPSGFKKAQAPWKLKVYEEAGQLKAKYSGPADTPNGLVTSDKAKAESNSSTDLQETKNGIKYKARLIHINPESKNYVQRIYIDTRKYTGSDKINVQITPKYKRDEIDYVPDKNGAKSPDIIKEGVKTAYRSTYKITGGVPDTEIDNVLRYYDLSKPNVSMTNTARWRPFDWGFDEDLLNLDKGVYFIDIEGFYDDAIITGHDSKQNKDTIPVADQGKLDLNIDFYDGERKFQQAKTVDSNGNITEWTKGTNINDAYLLGNVALGYVTRNAQGQDVPTEAGLKKLNENDKYPLWLGKTGGRIYPSLENASKTRVETRVDISSLYSSKTGRDVPQDGLTLTNEEESYNITFSKHGRDNPEDAVNSEKVTNKRLEGAIFKLQEDNGLTFEDVQGSFVSSAFNGYFGFRNLKPGRYRLMEVKAPEGYKPINGPLLYFTVETIKTNSGKIVHPETGEVVDIKSIQIKFFDSDPEVHNLSDLSMVNAKGETVAIKDAKSADINVENTKIINPHETDPAKKQVLLKELKIVGANKNYNIKDAKIIPGSSGYISLEYDKANGVYQYVPEKSTTAAEGKLIDFVTSATAKNMGKIVNEKPGEGSVKINKKDSDGKPLVGAEFTLFRLSDKDEKVVTTSESANIKEKATATVGLETTEKIGHTQINPIKSGAKQITGKTLANSLVTVTIPGYKPVTVRSDNTGKFAANVPNDGTLTQGEVSASINEEGVIVFDSLPIGNYRLVETKSPDGYENTGQVWNFTVGGEGLDPYAGPISQKGTNISDKIKLKTTKFVINNPQDKTITEVKAGMEATLKPHIGESMEFTNDYTVDPNLKIKPGDYFVIKMTDNMDLNGIFESEVGNLDILAPGVGTIAKAVYDRKARTITYTFTDYAKTYELLEFSNRLAAFIDLYKVKNSGKQTVGFEIDKKSVDKNFTNDISQRKNINVKYELDYAKGAKYNNTYRHWDQLNMVSKIVHYDQETGNFVQYFYINRLNQYASQYTEFLYRPEQNVENLNISIKNVTGQESSAAMPESFGIENPNSGFTNTLSLNSLEGGKDFQMGTYFPGEKGIGNGKWIIKVTGRVSGEDKSKYYADSRLVKYYNDNGTLGVERYDEIYAFKNEAVGEAKLEIQAVNPENKITFSKVDQNGKSLAGAKFKLRSKVQGTNTWSEGTETETKDDGTLTFTKLKPGEYELIETHAPDGHKMAKNPVVKFKVDKNGRITREVTDEKDKTTTTKDITNSTIYVVNKKEQEIVLKKVDATEKTVLEGAEFEVLYKLDKKGEYSKDNLKLYEKKDASGAVVDRLVIMNDDDVPKGYDKVDNFTTGKDGLVKFKIYEPGYYAIKETKAPKGYIKPRDIVKEFAFLDGKVQEEKYLTEMQVSKTKGYGMSNDVLQNAYSTSIVMKFNPDHQNITYTKDNSKLTLSGLPLGSEFWDNSFNKKQGIKIDVYSVDKVANKEVFLKTYDLGTGYDSKKGSQGINLYDLLKSTGATSEDSFESDKTIVLRMSSTLGLKTELDIKSNITIGDKISEDRTFNIGTKEEYVDHSYSFETTEEIAKDSTTNAYKPIDIDNRKATYPLTGAMGIIGFIAVGVVMMATAYYKYRRKRRESALS